MSDVEVIELASPGSVLLEHVVPDPLAGAKVVSLGAGGVPDSMVGPAGGVLAGNYPDPGFAQPMATDAELQAHVTAEAPHPHYDDMGSLRLLFESRLP